MNRIHPKHAADLAALALTPYAMPSGQHLTVQPLPISVGQEEEEYEWSYSPLSSPQVTPTPSKGGEELNAFPFPSSYSSSSLDSEQDSFFSGASSTSSASSSIYAQSPKIDASSASMSPAPLLRTSSCRYASFPSGPAAVMMDDGIGGTGMVRSYSNPVHSIQTAQELASVYAQEVVELRRNQSSPHLHPLANTTDSIPRTLSSGNITASQLRNKSASLFHQAPQAFTPIHPTSPQRGGRPALGRFFSMPSVMIE